MTIFLLFIIFNKIDRQKCFSMKIKCSSLHDKFSSSEPNLANMNQASSKMRTSNLLLYLIFIFCLCPLLDYWRSRDINKQSTFIQISNLNLSFFLPSNFENSWFTSIKKKACLTPLEKRSMTDSAKDSPYNLLEQPIDFSDLWLTHSIAPSLIGLF